MRRHSNGAKKHGFPQHLFVRIENKGEEDEYFESSRRGADAVEDDGPTKVATYQLIEVNEIWKEVASTKA